MWSRIANLFLGNRRSTPSPTGGAVSSLAPLEPVVAASSDSEAKSITRADEKPTSDRDLAVDQPTTGVRENEVDSPQSTNEHIRPLVEQAADIDDAESTEELSARWAAASHRPLVYAHKLRLDRKEFSRPSEPVPPDSGTKTPAIAVTLPVSIEESLPASIEQRTTGERNPENEFLGSKEAFSVRSTIEGPGISNLEAVSGSYAADTALTPAAAPNVPPSSAREAAEEISNELLSSSATSGWGSTAPSVRETIELATDTPTQATNRFSMLRAVANQWRAKLAPCDYLFVLGSAAEGRKMAPVIRALRKQGDGPKQVLVCVAGEHPARTRESLSLIGIEADLELSMPAYQESLEEVRTRMITGFGKILTEVKPQWVVVQGDSTTAAMASIAAYYAQIRVAHIEGGTALHDTHVDEDSNPETIHHLIANLFASVHFAETSWSKDALIREGVPEQSILVTGNTGVDITHETSAALGLTIGATAVRSSGMVRVLIIVEQPETITEKLPDLCKAIRNLARSVPGLYQFNWPLHADSRGQQLVNEMLDRVPGVVLSGPSTYEHFLRQLIDCDLVLTDVEDVQEEAPSFGKPVLLLAQTTHRPEAARAGITTLVAGDEASIQAAVRTLARKLSVRHGSITNPYGDGKAAVRILDFFEGRQVLEFGRSALPRLSAVGESPSVRRLGTSTGHN